MHSSHYACVEGPYDREMLVGSILSHASAVCGFMATSIAVGGFLAHVRPALGGAGDSELRYATVAGGLIGLVVAILVTAISIWVG